jgi:hypothetical protein
MAEREEKLDATKCPYCGDHNTCACGEDEDRAPEGDDAGGVEWMWECRYCGRVYIVEYEVARIKPTRIMSQFPPIRRPKAD